MRINAARSCILALSLLCLLAMACNQGKEEPVAPGQAKIYLSNGSIFVGKIVGLKDETYTVEIQNGTRLDISQRDIERIEYSPPLEGDPPPPPPPPPREVPAADLRFHGSNTIGEKLVPALVEAFVTARGGSQLSWLAGAQEGERLLQVGNAHGSVPRQVEVAAHGSSTAFSALKEGRADIGMASRSIKQEEALELADLGDFKGSRSEHVLALDGLAVIVHPSNPVTALSRAQIASLFAGEITSWQQLGGRPGPVTIYARDDRSGTFDTFVTLVLKPNGKSLAASAQRFESSSELSDSVARDPQAIGFIGLSYIRQAKALDIVECELSYAATPFAVKTEEYPLARRLHLYTPDPPRSPFASDFVEFALGDDGQKIVQETGFVDLSIEPGSPREQQPRLAAASVSAQQRSELDRLIQETWGAERLSVTFRFHTNSAELDNRAVRDLKRLASFMRRPEMGGRQVLLLGFTDSVGDYGHNRQLSRERAGSVADFLRREGVENLRVEGFGEEAPVACNDSDEGRHRNRHVEVWVR